ncbi:hypothetical protein DFH27DRAFT_200971 [Peziza echinospora]|nr:hypothetical protein DFH27DRAFT_200971 [Peziza echinospora]
MQFIATILVAFAALAVAAPAAVPEVASLGNPVRTVIDIPTIPKFTITRVNIPRHEITPAPVRSEITAEDNIVVRTEL